MGEGKVPVRAALAQETTETMTSTALAFAFLFVAHAAPDAELATRQRATAAQLHGQLALGRWTLNTRFMGAFFFIFIFSKNKIQVPDSSSIINK